MVMRRKTPPRGGRVRMGGVENLPPLGIASSIHKANRQIQSFMEAECRRQGVSVVEAHLLDHCLEFGPCWISELYRVLGEKPSTLTSILDRLEEAGALSRKLNRQDKRSRLVYLTPEGKRLALKLRGLYEEFESALLQRLRESDLASFGKIATAISEVTSVEARSSMQSQPPRKQGQNRRGG
jgi:DNA-binding MarR family transcriptional regulator